MIYTSHTHELTIVLSDDVLNHFKKHQQKLKKDKESGGQLFAKIDIKGHHWSIVKATGPNHNDFRSRLGFKANRKKEQEDIDSAFNNGLHFVGDWHTHPESHPNPSLEDRNAIFDIFKKSKHELPGFIMIIIGNNKMRDLWISISTDKEIERLELQSFHD